MTQFDATLLLMEVSPFYANHGPSLFNSLSPNEKTRANEFVFSADRETFIVAHGVLRHALANRLATSPGDINFRYTPNGKPVLDDKHSSPNGHFNISHLRDTVACLLAPVECGVDLVRPTSPIPFETLHSTEKKRLWDAPPSKHPMMFAQIWALKEAYLKATGQGLGVAPETIEIQNFPEQMHVNHNGTRIKGWHFELFGDQHNVIACALARKEKITLMKVLSMNNI